MITLIAAIAKNGVIGKTGHQLPWKISEEIKLFKEVTTGHTIIMGRKTYDSIGKPLPNRNNIVISRTVSEIDGVDVCSSLEEAIEKGAALGKEVFVIGGAIIFKDGLEIADRLFLSHIKQSYEGDVFFPEIDQERWNVVSEKDYDEFTFKEYERVRQAAQ